MKYEDIYLKDYSNGAHVNDGLTRWSELMTRTGGPDQGATSSENSGRGI